MFRWKTLAVGVAASALALTACSGSADSTSSGGSDTLTLGVIVAATTFEAAGMSFANESPYGQAVYDSLLTADPDNTIEPSLATDWSYNDDQTVLTLDLRDDVTFTDGEKFDADAAVQNLLRFRDGTSANASYLAAVKDVVAVDDDTIEIQLDYADPALLINLTKNAGYQESPAAFENDDVQTNPVGSGAYILDTSATVAGSSYTFTKNDDYWNPDNQHYDKLVIKVYSDSTALLNAIKGGQVNAANTLDNSTNDEIEAAGYTLVPFELNWAGMILYDRGGTINPALGDVRVRQAINYAFDRDGLLESLGDGLGTVTEQIFPTSSEAYDESLDSTYSYDPEKAKELLAEAGYADGFSLDLPMSSLFDTSLTAIIEQQLGDIGIAVTWTDTGNNFITDIIAGKYAATWMTLEQNSDWDLINFAISPTATWNSLHYEDDTMNGYIDAYKATTDDAERAEIAKQINTYTVEQAWFAPWYRPQSTYVTDANTTAVAQTSNAYPYLWNITPKE